MSLFKKNAVIILIIIITPIILLIFFLSPSLIRKKEKAKIILVEMDFKIIEKALHEFKKDTGNFPKSRINLNALYENPRVKDWTGPYIPKEKIHDPWGLPYKFENHFENDLPSFVASLGKNKKWDTSKDDIRNKQAANDDIIRWLE